MIRQPVISTVEAPLPNPPPFAVRVRHWDAGDTLECAALDTDQVDVKQVEELSHQFDHWFGETVCCELREALRGLRHRLACGCASGGLLKALQFLLDGDAFGGYFVDATWGDGMRLLGEQVIPSPN